MYAYSGDKNPITEENRICNQRVGDGIFSSMMGIYRMNSKDYGVLIFPEETKVLEHTSNIQIIGEQTTLRDVTVLGCVIYRFTLDGKPHRTGFVWGLQTAQGRIDLKGPDVPIDQLRFYNRGMGDFAD
jgi:hypothetical protein